MSDYSDYQHILVERRDGIAVLTMNRPEVLNATNFRLHNELSRIWLDLGADPEVRVAVITGSGSAFSAGGDFEMIEQAMGNPEVIASNTQEASDIVYNLLNLDITNFGGRGWNLPKAWGISYAPKLVISRVYSEPRPSSTFPSKNGPTAWCYSLHVRITELWLLEHD